MPYTIDELQTLDFYNGFRNNLRAQHIDELIIYALNRFRDSEGVLYSFEAIERDPELGVGMGIENSELLKTQTGPYTRLPLELSKESEEAETETINETPEENVSEDTPEKVKSE